MLYVLKKSMCYKIKKEKYLKLNLKFLYYRIIRIVVYLHRIQAKYMYL